MFEDEVRQLLAELASRAGITDAAIVDGDRDAVPETDTVSLEGFLDGDGDMRSVPLGNGDVLLVHFESGTDKPACAETIERAVRALRACAKRWDSEGLPVTSSGDPQPLRARIIGRIETYLEALANSQDTANAVVYCRGELIASSAPMDPLHQDRIPFIVKRVEAEAAKHKGTSSHASLDGDDFFAISFWYDACLVLFFSGPFALDFVRHRARLVIREIGNLMPDLDDPPRDPAKVAPIPE